jgi:hypothetical protein
LDVRNVQVSEGQLVRDILLKGVESSRDIDTNVARDVEVLEGVSN